MTIIVTTNVGSQRTRTAFGGDAQQQRGRAVGRMTGVLLRDVPPENPFKGDLWNYHIHYGVARVVAVVKTLADFPLLGTRRGNDPVCWWSADNDDQVFLTYEDAADAAIAAGWDGENRFSPSYHPTTVGEGGAFVPSFE